MFLGTFSNNKKYTGTPSPCNFYIQFILNFQGSTFCASLEIFNLKTLLTFGFSAQSLSNIAIFVLTIIYKMFWGTFQNVPMFLHFWKKCSVRTEQNMFCQNIEKMFCQNRTFARTLGGGGSKLPEIMTTWFINDPLLLCH